MQPDVSVVIPTYNRRTYLQQAVESCFEGNDEIDVEVVVVDDGSTDGTRDYLRSIDDDCVQPFFQEHQGAQVARNRGMDEARGWAIKFLDDDDYLLPGALMEQCNVLEKGEVDVCYGDFMFKIGDAPPGRRFTNGERTSFFVGLASGAVNRLPLMLLFRRSALSEVRWDESLEYLQDVSFMVQAASQRLSCEKVKKPVGIHRIHGNDRISNKRNRIPRLQLIDMICDMYWQAYRQLSRNDALNKTLRAAAATGIWREAYKAAPLDIRMFMRWYKRIKCIKPDFSPPRSHWTLGALDRCLSPKHTELLIYPLRKMKAHLT